MTVSQPFTGNNPPTMLSKLIEEQQFMTRRNSELIVVGGEPMLAYDGLKLDEQVAASMKLVYEAGREAGIKEGLNSYGEHTELAALTPPQPNPSEDFAV